MAQRMSQPPTRADLDALPPNIKGEIVEGVMYTMTRPRARHQSVGGSIYSDLANPFGRKRGGPGGWWILPEPGIELPNTPEIAPDVAGWRRERMPELPDGPLTIVPDWVCEVLSRSTRRHNLLIKKPYYARIGVQWHWLVDIDSRTVTVLSLVAGAWTEIGTYGDETEALLPPFDALPLDVSSWWAGLPAE
jgi:Uma2 family endonuclease